MAFVPGAAVARQFTSVATVSPHGAAQGRISLSASDSSSRPGLGSKGTDRSALRLTAGLVSVLALRRLARRQGYEGGAGRGGGYGGRKKDIDPGELRRLTEIKKVREANDFVCEQESILKRGSKECTEFYWSREERKLFQSEHVTKGINFGNYDSIPVETSGGQGTEEVIENFQAAGAKFGLPDELKANIDRCGYEQPTPVQKHAIPAVLGGSDVLVTAQTGSGKTAAFLVPIVATALKAGVKPFQKGPARPTAVVLSPTRELCQQIAVEAQRLCFKSSARVVEIYGGADSRPQLGGLAKGCEIVVATPGRLQDYLERDFITMEDVQFLTLDEADRMLDMGFEPQIRSIVENFGMPEPGIGDEGRQTMMFSATFPKEMQDMALDYLHPAYFQIEVGRVGATSTNVEQRFEDSSATWDKFEMLMNSLKKVTGPDGAVAKTLVFANQKRMVDEITNRLAGGGIQAAPMHGDIDQRDRNRAIADLKSGQLQVLVATDVAARGLDLPGIAHVVNFDLPLNDDDYVHRIGRTGRIGNKGVATSFVGKDEPALKGIVKAMKKALDSGDEGAGEVPLWMEERMR